MLVEESKNPMFHVYRMEELHPICEYNILPLVSIRSNETARLMLNLKVGELYTVADVLEAFDHMIKQVDDDEVWAHYIGYRLFSCVQRLIFFDPLVEA